VRSPAHITRRRGARLSVDEYAQAILAGDRVILAQAITLVESDLPADTEATIQLLDALLPHIGKTRRLGITGIPGVGKSTFIDALGTHLTRDRGERIAVLSVDPSSAVTRGSILGDKTRMERLAADDRAFIRPSPSGGQLGGVARRTREAILLCEAGGYRNIFIETVGVGQSETAVHSLSDFFLLLMLPGAGDELQGIKRGILELVDGVAINKADGENLTAAERTRAAFTTALHLLSARGNGWTPRVLTCSALKGTGIPGVWEMVLKHESELQSSGELQARRNRGSLQWMRDLVAGGLNEIFQSTPAVEKLMPAVEQQVSLGQITPLAASRKLLEAFKSAL